MKCQNLFSGKNKKNISKCRLLNILLRLLRVQGAIKFKLPSLHVGDQLASLFVADDNPTETTVTNL